MKQTFISGIPGETCSAEKISEANISQILLPPFLHIKCPLLPKSSLHAKECSWRGTLEASESTF